MSNQYTVANALETIARRVKELTPSIKWEVEERAKYTTSSMVFTGMYEEITIKYATRTFDDFHPISSEEIEAEARNVAYSVARRLGQALFIREEEE
jgi:hypothetical protein